MSSLFLYIFQVVKDHIGDRLQGAPVLVEGRRDVQNFTLVKEGVKADFFGPRLRYNRASRFRYIFVQLEGVVLQVKVEEVYSRRPSISARKRLVSFTSTLRLLFLQRSAFSYPFSLYCKFFVFSLRRRFDPPFRPFYFKEPAIIRRLAYSSPTPSLANYIVNLIASCTQQGRDTRAFKPLLGLYGLLGEVDIYGGGHQASNSTFLTGVTLYALITVRRYFVYQTASFLTAPFGPFPTSTRVYQIFTAYKRTLLITLVYISLARTVRMPHVFPASLVRARVYITSFSLTAFTYTLKLSFLLIQTPRKLADSLGVSPRQSSPSILRRTVISRFARVKYISSLFIKLNAIPRFFSQELQTFITSSSILQYTYSSRLTAKRFISSTNPTIIRPYIFASFI